MPIDVGALGGVIYRADLDGLARLTLEDADDLSGGSADGVVDVRATLVQASLSCAGAGWEGHKHEVEARAVVRVLGRVALLAGADAAARVVWGLCGGDTLGFFGSAAVWVAGPAGLAIWGGTSRRSEMTEWESAVEVEGWDKVLSRLEDFEL